MVERAPLHFLDIIKEQHNLDTLLFVDFETFFKTKGTVGNKSYSLKSLPVYDYILGERFQTLGLGLAEDDSDVEYLIQPSDIGEFFEEIRDRRADGERIGLVAFNTPFDGAICNWRFATSFDYYFDVQCMRRILAPHRPQNLKQSAIDMWPDDEEMRKGGDELAAVDGVRFEYITDEQHEHLKTYCIQDVRLTRDLFICYYAQLTSMGLELEFDLMNITLRGDIEPQFVIDEAPLDERIAIEIERNERLIKDALDFLKDKFNFDDVTVKTFSSDKQFAQLLTDLSIPIPRKFDVKDRKEKNAFAQTDPEYLEMKRNHPHLEPVYRARAVAKSNTALTRAQQFKAVKAIFTGKSNSPQAPCDMPFFLNYYGADQTGRWSGGQKLNQQNLTADRAGDLSDGHHRRSLTAPNGEYISVVDLSNIELRVNMWFCGQDDILHQLRSDPMYDYYCDLASGIFNRPIDKKVDKFERQMGKAAGLQLGFATSPDGFKRYLMSGPMGMEPILREDAFYYDIKNAYDRKHPMVVRMWQFIARVVIPAIINDREVRFGPNGSFIARHEQIELPSGRILQYPGANWAQNGKATFHSGKFYKDGTPVLKNLWHGLIMNNCVQGTARDVLGYQKVNVEHALQAKQYGYVIGSVHDETLSRLKPATVEIAHKSIEQIMSTPPPWAADIPLACEGGYALEYSK